MKQHFLLSLSAIAFAGLSQAQTILPANLTANNGGSVNWGLYFDVAASANALTITELRTANTGAAGAAVEFEVLTFVGSGLGTSLAVGPGTSLLGWTSLGNGAGFQGPTASGISESIDIPDIVIPAGQTVGVCLRFVVAGPRYFGTGTGPYTAFTDGNLTLTAGDSRSAPFTTTGSYFSPRGLTGELTYVGGIAGGIGASYCGPAALNTSGGSGVITATGSDVVANNNLTLVARSVPANQFGFFLASQTQGNVPMAGGSNGTLCLSGTIALYVGAGQIKNAGAAGTFDLALDLAQTPAGPVFVAIAAGETWNFQAWFRDIGAMGQPESNFTDGRTITFQ